MAKRKLTYAPTAERLNPPEFLAAEDSALPFPACAYRDDARGIWLYHGDSLALLEAIEARHPDGCFDAIFADPPYFLSNGGITCKSGRMASVDKGEWDRSRGTEANHAFNVRWLGLCQRLLKPHGTIWVSGTHHAIFSVGYAMQQLGFKILNDIVWEKPNPPPNLSCRYFTHSTETVIWAARNEKSRHLYNYQLMRRLAGGKQMKTVWRIPPPSRDEKRLGRHPTQKPVALVERCLLASTKVGDLVLDPFMGGGTTALACLFLRRHFIGTDIDLRYVSLAMRRLADGLVVIWEGQLRISFEVSVFAQKDLDLPLPLINRSGTMGDTQVPATCTVFHERKFVFISCSPEQMERVLYTAQGADLQGVLASAPAYVRDQATHVIRCDLTLVRLKTSCSRSPA